MKTAEEWAREEFGFTYIDDIEPQTRTAFGTTKLLIQIKRIQLDALLEAAEIINTRMSLLETWGDDETRENIHIKEIRALRPVYDAILARAKEVESQPHSTDEKKI